MDVISLFKKENPLKKENYRPVTMLPHLSKGFGRIIKNKNKQINIYIKQNEQINIYVRDVIHGGIVHQIQIFVGTRNFGNSK